jgi:uncharacterized protein
MISVLRSFCVFCVLTSCALAQAQNLVPVPPLTAHVIDQTGTLDAIQLKGLEDKLMAFEQAKGTQIAILMVPTTQPEDDASFANRVGNTWKIGRKGVGDGVLVVVAKDDRKVRIEVAKALEGAIPDLAAKRVIDEAMIPSFRSGDYAAGLRAGADQLIARINGEALPAPPQPKQQRQEQRASGHGFDWGDLAIFLFIGVFVVGRVLRGILGRPIGSLVAGAGVGWVAMLITSSFVIAAIAGVVALLFTLLTGFGSSGSRRGGFTPWIGGGGFGAGGGSWGGGGGGWGGSGGGGDFGGGGASGNW